MTDLIIDSKGTKLMNAVDTKLNYFSSKLEEVKKAELEFKYLNGKFQEELAEWLKSKNVPENFNLIELCQIMRKKHD